MKKALLLVGVAALLLGALPLSAANWDDDQMHIIVQVGWVGVTLYQDDGTTAYGNWLLGNMPAGATAAMFFDDPDVGADDHIEAINEGNCAVDLAVYSDEAGAPVPCGFGVPACWHPWDGVPVPGPDEYILECGEGGALALPGGYVLCPDAVSPGVPVVGGLAAAVTAHLFLNFTTPDPVADGCVHDVTVTVLATIP